MPKHISKIVYVFAFVMFTSIYFFYAFKVYLPKQSMNTANYFITNESSRHILKVSILSERALSAYIEALEFRNEDLLYDSIDLMTAAGGFLITPSFKGIKEAKKVISLIDMNIVLMEENSYDISSRQLKILKENVKNVSRISQTIEIKKYNNLLKGVIDRESRIYVFLIGIVYLVLSVILLIFLLLFVLSRNKRLEDENLKQQKILLTQSKMLALTEMLGNIAHQWRQPLSVITSAVSGMKFELEVQEDISRESILRCSDAVMKQASYLSKTIDDFKEFIAEDNNDKIVQVSDVFLKLESLVDEMFKTNSITLVKDVEENVSLKLNDNILIQAFINICYNSKDAFVLNEVNKEERYFFISCKKDKNKVTISLKDTAGGIKEEIIDKIFEPYFTTKHKARGIGVGLYKTNEIITKNLLGSIEAKNAYSHLKNKEYMGGEFIITLPAFFKRA
ncbi:MAG: HAMP domain-containing histidine kinase [Campylobacteraceae bacterium]|nr:HAMP domain-containing histidine kinase [Campylobacteraceae bacterium]